LFNGENISLDASLVIHINSTNIPSIMIINRIYENQNLVTVACFLPGRAKDLSAPGYVEVIIILHYSATIIIQITPHPKDFHVNAAVLTLYDKHTTNVILIDVLQGCKCT
jgi:hypothetical protein